MTEERKLVTMRGLMVCLGLVVAIVAVYWQVHAQDFIDLDDPDYVTRNKQVSAGVTPGSIRWALTAREKANWHPATWISLMTDVSVFGVNAPGHKIVNVTLHAINALLLFGALRYMTRRFWPSALVAALFAVHPLHVESVAWIAERKDVLSALFWILTIWLWAWYATAPRLPRLVPVACAFGVGLTAKPMLVTLPVILLLLDIWPLNRWTAFPADEAKPGQPRFDRTNLPSLIMEKLELSLMSIAVCVMTIMAQAGGGATAPGRTLTLGERLSNAVVAGMHYLGKLVWPVELSLLYPHPSVYDGPGWPTATVALAAVLLGGLTVAAVVIAARTPHRFVAVGWLWCCIAMLPVIGIVQVGVQSMADRYTYLPFIGLYIILAFGLAALVERFAPLRWPVVAACVLALAALGARAHDQVALWRDSVTIFSHAVAIHPDNAHMHYGLSTAFNSLALRHEQLAEAAQKKRFNDAANARQHAAEQTRHEQLAARYHVMKLEALDRTIELIPNHGPANRTYGIYWNNRGDRERAILHFRRALDANPNWDEVKNHLRRLERSAVP